MMLDIEAMITEVIEREGRTYTNHAADRGGPTKFGITQRALSTYRGVSCTANDVQNLKEPEARDIYRNRYLITPGLYKIRDPYVVTLAFDCAVNHGPFTVVQWLQRIVGIQDDGVFGNVTEAAINAYEPTRLYQKLLARRIVFYGEIINHDHSQAVFALGWLRRAASFIERP